MSERERNKKAVVLEKIYLYVYYYQRTVSSHISVRSLSVLFPTLKMEFLKMKKGRQMAEIIRPISFYRPVMRSSFFFLSLSHPKPHSHRLSIGEQESCMPLWTGELFLFFLLLLLFLLLGFFSVLFRFGYFLNPFFCRRYIV